ncbi:BCCT family transporter [Rhodobacteraceae bacterium 2CG4]|uniref:BCCT family transporter n=1 Tax=Halovulum marinum TaxID=2662447 RepID=A0A6L5YWA6_9RHOB|nr:BCCT family transporter [Halovulum marinum]MSU88581.1 BCCT family transporter [Halovulum marinum]
MPNPTPPLELNIRTADRGFYRGYTKDVTITAKLIVGALIVWAVAFPGQAAAALGQVNTFILASFNHWYMYLTAVFVVICVALALVPAAGRLRLGTADDRPEFSRFSWFSMMFGAGLGIGVLTYSTGEPLYHFQQNPDTIMGLVEAGSAETLRSAYKWTFFHWGLTAWATYALTGAALAYFAYRRGLPMTIRSGMAAIFGRHLSGPLGHAVDIIAVVATTLGVAQTLGYGVAQFVTGMHRIGLGDWVLTGGSDGALTPSSSAIVLAVVVILGASTLSALSGVGKGIKWLSNINMGLSLALLAFFLLFGATAAALKAFSLGTLDYLLNLPTMALSVWTGPEGSTGAALEAWQGGWSIFYWAWWIASAPFVGLFLARISKGRTLREFMLGAMIMPSVMCFVWFALLGATAIDLEMSGVAQGSIAGTSVSDQLYATLAQMLEPSMAWLFSVLVVVLLLTYQITTADSAVLIINTINAAGDDGPKARPHILFWGAALALTVGALLLVGGLQATQAAMMIAALPFSAIILLVGVSLIRAIAEDIRQTRRQKIAAVFAQ